MKTLILGGLIAIAAISNAHAMRCGTHLIDEGDNIQNVYEYCGHPIWVSYDTAAYMHKDGLSMNYYIHINPQGVITEIEESMGN